jgi:hypothetical protein
MVGSKLLADASLGAARRLIVFFVLHISLSQWWISLRRRLRDSSSLLSSDDSQMTGGFADFLPPPRFYKLFPLFRGVSTQPRGRPDFVGFYNARTAQLFS